ncbi:hypothetical protein SAMN06295967_11211 [Belliella buryatensis]|uniref:Uncharacterized protein n=1 Tax=Belliella buryatensis TaxID=1500549 RepID=A0A239FBM7_9BACT|nr:hypothetical protein [Belliella buryatensis]SNS53713.1 hypothetical protein SAMN06295967_11211 [Belliella buryatensis]
MGKFIISETETNCKQTGKTIKKGESCFYHPGLGHFHPESVVYRDKKISGGSRMGNFRKK